MGRRDARGGAALSLRSVTGRPIKFAGVGEKLDQFEPFHPDRLAGRILGWNRGEANLIGWLLQTKALIMIIFAQVLLDRQIISSAAFTALLLMAVGSTMLTIPAVRLLQRRQADQAGGAARQ